MAGRGVLVLLSALALAPLALAAEGDEPPAPVALRVQTFDSPVAPLRETVARDVVVEVPCAALANRTEPLDVALALSGVPAYARASIAPSGVRLRHCEDGVEVANVTARVLLAFDGSAPAFRPVRFQVTATPPGGEPASADVTALPGFLGILDAETQEPLRDVAPGEAVEFVVRLTNHGNGMQRVRAEVAQATKGFAAVVPPPVVVPANADGLPPEATMVVTVLAPERFGAVDEPGLVQITLIGAFANDESLKGEAVSQTFLLRARGVSLEGPPLAPLALGALALGGLAWWRLRSR